MLFSSACVSGRVGNPRDKATGLSLARPARSCAGVCLYWGGLGYGQCMLRTLRGCYMHACQPGTCSVAVLSRHRDLLRADFFARPPYQCHGIALARLSGCVFSVKSGLLRHVAEEGCGMLQAGSLRGTCLQCAGIRVQKGVVCVCALARDRLSEMHACVRHVCVCV